jgi:serine/threonine-protein kinase
LTRFAIEEGRVTCSACGADLTPDQLFCPRCGTRAPATDPGAPVSDTAALLARAVGAGYEVGALIGRGGFGEVYAAADRSLKRTVAIKVLRADVADSRTAIDRFRREAESLARLRHPHIMPVFGIGEGEGLTYFVMPRIEGESLSDLLVHGEKLSLADACRVIAETADALAAAHRAGVVHRDIKPDNILLEGVERHALLMDFGIAKSGGAEGRLTATGMIIGTPMYMSPEQASGDHIGPGSDIYSLGVVAYELLAGEPIFGKATSPQQIIAAHLAQAPEDLRAVNPHVPAAVAKAVMRCLRKSPTDRWPTVEEFVRAFEKARADLPRDPEVVIPDAPLPLAPRRRLVLAALGLVGAAVAFAVFSTAQPNLDAPHTTRATALADAESVLSALGVPRYRERVWEFSPASPIGRFLEDRGSAPAPSTGLLSRVRLGEWRFAFYTPGSPGYVRLYMGGPGWTGDFERVLDSATARRAAADSASAVPVAATLSILGWAPDSLRFADSSRALVDGRVERTYKWTPIGVSGLVVGADTVARQVRATFTGSLLTRYETSSKVTGPDAAHRKLRQRVAIVAWPVLVVLVLAGVVATLIVAHRRRALRWGRALRIAAVFGPAIGVSVAPWAPGSPVAAFNYDFVPERTQLAWQVVRFAALALVISPFLFVAGAALFAACEAMALRDAPGLLAGCQVPTSRPSLRGLARPLPVGTASGLVVAGVAALAGFAVAQFTSMPLTAGQGWTHTRIESVAQLITLAAFGPAIAAAGVLLLAPLRAVGSPAKVARGALLVGLGLAAAALALNASAVSVAMLGTGAAGLALIIAWRGVVEGAVAFVAAELALEAAEVWRAPFSDPWPVTAVLALLVACAVVAGFGSASPPRGAGSRAKGASL